MNISSVSEMSIENSEAAGSGRNFECFGQTSTSLINDIEYEENNGDFLYAVDAESEQLSISNEQGLLPLPLDSHSPITFQLFDESEVRQFVELRVYDPILTAMDHFSQAIPEGHSTIQEGVESSSDANEEDLASQVSISHHNEIHAVENTCEESLAISKDEICEIQFATSEIEFLPESVNDHIGETLCESETDVHVKAKTCDTKQKSHECEICGKCFARKDHLTTHKYTHAKEKQFKCETCGKCFQFPHTLKEHKNLHTQENLFKCEKCGKSFVRSNHLLRHNKACHTKRPYECETCKKCFACDSDLTIHRMSHTTPAQKIFKCETCDRCFARAIYLTRHKLCHTGQKNYQCETCDRCFARAGDLASHKLCHTGQKNFQCEMCGKCFTRKSNMKTHKNLRCTRE